MYEKGTTQMKLAPPLKPLRRGSLRPLTSLMNVPRGLRDPVSDLLPDSPEKSKGPGAGWDGLQQSESHSLGSWCVSTENASKEHVSYWLILWCNKLILLCWVVIDLALDCHLERPGITAEESQGYTVGCSGAKGGVDETHKPCRKPQVREPSGLPEEPSQMPTPVNFQHLSQPKGNGTLVVPDKWNLSCLFTSPPSPIP